MLSPAITMLCLGITIVKRFPRHCWLLRFPLLYLLRSEIEAPAARGTRRAYRGAFGARHGGRTGEARRRRRAGTVKGAERLTPFGLLFPRGCAASEGARCRPGKATGPAPGKSRPARPLCGHPARSTGPLRRSGLSKLEGRERRSAAGRRGKGAAAQRGRGEHSPADVPSRDRPEAAARRSRDRVRIEGRRPALDRHQVKHAPREGQGNGSPPCPPRVQRGRW